MKPPTIIIACEASDVIRSAFELIGFDAWSCDLVPSENSENTKHLQCDVLTILSDRYWDMMICHPPCTNLSVSGARWFKDKVEEQPASIRFANALWEAPINRICLENPVSILTTYLGKPTQTIQPWQFGHGEVKRTCFWLKNLPKLIPDNPRSGREARIHNMAPSENRGRERSKTFEGVADAMARQWGMPILGGTIDLLL